MSVVIRAHFDGTNIVPEEPVDLPVNQSMEVEFRIADTRLSEDEITRRKAAWKRAGSRAVKGADISSDALRRENMYESTHGL